MSANHQTDASEIPPEYRLPVVQNSTVELYEFRPPDFDSQLHEFTVENRRLLLWMRTEATRLFPHDLQARKAAISLSLGTLSITQNQKTIDQLRLQFAVEFPPAA